MERPAPIALVIRGRHLAASGGGRELRERAGLSLAEAARELGITASGLGRYERGERSPRPAIAAGYARLLARLERELARRAAT
jgi:transcriptional regulator with XRE-family HTH domain